MRECVVDSSHCLAPAEFYRILDKMQYEQIGFETEGGQHAQIGFETASSSQREQQFEQDSERTLPGAHFVEEQSRILQVRAASNTNHAWTQASQKLSRVEGRMQGEDGGDVDELTRGTGDREIGSGGTKRHTDYIQLDEDVEVRGSAVSVSERGGDGRGGSGCGGSGVRKQQGCSKRMRGDSGLLQREGMVHSASVEVKDENGFNKGTQESFGGKFKKAVVGSLSITLLLCSCFAVASSS
jgi:hypothetical protein